MGLKYWNNVFLMRDAGIRWGFVKLPVLLYKTIP